VKTANNFEKFGKKKKMWGNDHRKRWSAFRMHDDVSLLPCSVMLLCFHDHVSELISTNINAKFNVSNYREVSCVVISLVLTGSFRLFTKKVST
jgi:hypothetical protein